MFSLSDILLTLEASTYKHIRGWHFFSDRISLYSLEEIQFISPVEAQVASDLWPVRLLGVPGHEESMTGRARTTTKTLVVLCMRVKLPASVSYLKAKTRLWQSCRRRFQEEASLKLNKQPTSLPERRLIEQPPPEKKPKWSSVLGAVLRGILIWMPRLWKVVEIIFGWFNPPPS